MSNEKALWSTLGGQGLASGAGIASPWQDYASAYAPTSIKTAMQLCEILYLRQGIYKKASERIVDYFLTKPIFRSQDDNERKKFEKVMTLDFGIMENLRDAGIDKMCFHGDTRAITKNGVFKIRDLAGTTVDALSQGGVYRPAEFKSFGQQRLMEVEFSDGSILLATPEHEWVAKNCSGRDVRVPTLSLRKGYRIERTVAPRPDKNDDFYEGVRHGFTFGDGSLYNDGRQAAAYFFGDKDAELLKHFEGHGCEPLGPDEAGKRTVNGLPPHYKNLPKTQVSASYWYGFVCGFLAADGSADIYGCAVLTQKSRATLEFILEQLPRIGMVGGPVRKQDRVAEFVRDDGRVDVYDGEMHFLTLLKRFMQVDDFLLTKHRENFLANPPSQEYGRFIGVHDVRETGIVDEVFCCVEMETHTFVVGNGILSGNCYGNNFLSIHLPFSRVLRCVTCSSEQKMVMPNGKMAEFHFSNVDYSFHARCNSCKTVMRHMVRDYPNKDAKKIKLVRWDPKRITIEQNDITRDKRFWLEIDPTVMNKVRSGDPFTLATLPWSFITAIKNNQKYLFNNSRFFHSYDTTLAGVNLNGWGIPPILSAFRNFFRLQVLYRYDEVMKMDYIVPLRIVSPSIMKSSAGNNIMEINLRNFAQEAMSAVQRHKVDGADWNFFPFPVNYQAIGGEGMQLDQSTRDTIQNEEDRLLNVRGIPPELYRGSLTLVNAPVGLRLFEAGNSAFVGDMNRIMQWICTTVAKFMDTGDHEVSLDRVTITDNLDDKAWRLQAAMTGAISKETGLGPIGINAEEEGRRVIQEQMRDQKEQQKAQQEMQMETLSLGSEDQSAQQGQQPAGGGMTPMDLEAQGDEMARTLLDPAMPEQNRRQQLSALRTSNPTLHAIVIKKMDQYRNQAGGLGQAAGFQQLGIGQPQQQQKVASLEAISELMVRLNQAFPIPKEAAYNHSIVMPKDSSKMRITVWNKGASFPVLISQSDLSEPIETLVTEIKRTIEM